MTTQNITLTADGLATLAETARELADMTDINPSEGDQATIRMADMLTDIEKAMQASGAGYPIVLHIPADMEHPLADALGLVAEQAELRIRAMLDSDSNNELLEFMGIS
jgi:hypothetical protein